MPPYDNLVFRNKLFPYFSFQKFRKKTVQQTPPQRLLPLPGGGAVQWPHQIPPSREEGGGTTRILAGFTLASQLDFLKLHECSSKVSQIKVQKMKMAQFIHDKLFFSVFFKSRIWEILNLSACAASITNTPKNSENKKTNWGKKIKSSKRKAVEGKGGKI